MGRSLQVRKLLPNLTPGQYCEEGWSFFEQTRNLPANLFYQ